MSTRRDISVDWAGLTLAGTLHLPDGGGPHPTMLMIQGSGPADRDCEGYFEEIREPFLARGIATCAVDKPGCGASTGDWREHDLAARAQQSAAVLDALCQDDGVDAGRLGVWGQSQGGWVVQQLAAEGHGLRCAIANSGPSIGVTEQDEYALEQRLRGDGHDDRDVAEALGFLRALHGAALERRTFEAVMRDVVEPVVDRRWYGLGLTDDDADEWGLMVRFVTEAYDPIETLRRIELPFLAIFGGLDVLVPAWRCAAATGSAVASRDQPDSTVVVFPAADHRIRTASGAFAPGYLDLLGDWTRRRLSAET